MTDALDRVAVFGAGRAGCSLARALSAAGLRNVTLTTRTEATAAAARADGFDVKVGSVADAALGAQVVLLAVSDPALESIAQALSQSGVLASNAVVAHLSGPNDLSVLASLTAVGVQVGSLHPLVSMPTRTTPLAGGWAAVDGSGDEAAAVLEALASRVGFQTIRPRGDRARYHAAACLVGNYPQVLMAAAVSLLEACQVPPGQARDAMGALLVGAAGNAARMPAEDALTGPVSRGDVEVVRHHLASIKDAPSIDLLYRSGARLASELVRERHPERGEAIARLVSED